VEASEVVDESTQIQTGSSREYAFAMDVPEAAGPCLETEQTYVGWWLRATMVRGMAFDPDLQQLLNVYDDSLTLPQPRRRDRAWSERLRRLRGSRLSGETPVWAHQDAPSGAFSTGQTPTAFETPREQTVFAPPQAPPSGNGKTQR